MEIKRTAVFGMGALGLLFGLQIAEADGGNAVTFLMNQERAKRHHPSLTVKERKCLYFWALSALLI